MKKAVCLVSGGIDSATALASAQQDGFKTYALTFRYGQRHILELDSAHRVVDQLKPEGHLILDIDLGAIGGSALTSSIAVPKDRTEKKIKASIPITYVPARNTIFLSYALAWAETLKATAIFIGVTAIDYSGYPDCRPEYIIAFETMANLATKATVEGEIIIKVHAPLIKLSKAETIKKGSLLGVDYSLTWSCYDPDPQGRHCGRCDSCYLRKKGFSEAGIPDPTIYAC
ncbi:MAG: 7-cyano-7-deazaguanine synthase QueC [Pseudomonadota bacterium]